MQGTRLNPEQFQKVLSTERSLHDILPEMDKFEECGGDCQALRAAAQDMLAKIQKVKQYYNPNSANMR